MAKVMVELSMSLDGYVTGPDVSPEEPMGSRRRGPARLDVQGPIGGRVRGERPYRMVQARPSGIPPVMQC
jgi:hypothetical protein